MKINGFFVIKIKRNYTGVSRVDSKIAYIYRDNNSTKKELGFSYDAMGNRIAKHIFSATGVFEKSTYYVRDASGNTMLGSSLPQRSTGLEMPIPLHRLAGATYQSKQEPIGEWSYMLIERHIYGSSRVGFSFFATLSCSNSWSV